MHIRFRWQIPLLLHRRSPLRTTAFQNFLCSTVDFLEKEKQYKNKSYIKNSQEIETIGAKLSFEETHPSFDELIEDFKNLKSFVNVGKKYGVSDNGVRRWCEHYNIPKTKKKLFEFINKELS